MLEWRQHKLELELTKQQRLRYDLNQVTLGISQIHAAMVEGCPADPTGAELAALQQYLDRLYRDQARLEQRRVELNAALTQQNACVLAADRDVKILERLKERALTEWNHAANKEIEELAGENAINRWGRA